MDMAETMVEDFIEKYKKDMKHTYKKVYKRVKKLNSGGMAKALATIQAGQNGVQPEEEEEYTYWLIGGMFLPDSGNPDECDLKMTDYEIIRRNRDIMMDGHDYLAGFVGGLSTAFKTGIVGNWTEDIEKNANICYVIDGDQVREMILTQFGEFGFSNQNGIQVIVRDGDKMLDTILDEDDIVFTHRDEAEEYLKDKYKKEDNEK